MRGAGRAFVPSLVASLALSACEAQTSGSTSMSAGAAGVRRHSPVRIQVRDLPSEYPVRDARGRPYPAIRDAVAF